MAKTATTSYSAISGIVVAHYRTRAGLGQATVARRLGITPPSYSRLETGQTAWTVDMLFRMANLLNVDVTELTQNVQKAVGAILNQGAYEVLPVARSNTKGGGLSHQATGPFVAGAALGAVLAHLLDGD